MRAKEAANDADTMRDRPTSVGHGKWLVVLFGILVIAALFLLLSWFAGIR